MIYRHFKLSKPKGKYKYITQKKLDTTFFGNEILAKSLGFIVKRRK